MKARVKFALAAVAISAALTAVASGKFTKNDAERTATQLQEKKSEEAKRENEGKVAEKKETIRVGAITLLDGGDKIVAFREALKRGESGSASWMGKIFGQMDMQDPGIRDQVIMIASDDNMMVSYLENISEGLRQQFSMYSVDPSQIETKEDFERAYASVGAMLLAQVMAIFKAGEQVATEWIKANGNFVSSMVTEGKEIKNLNIDWLRSNIGADGTSCIESFLKGLVSIIERIDSGDSLGAIVGDADFLNSLLKSAVGGMIELYWLVKAAQIVILSRANEDTAA